MFMHPESVRKEAQALFEQGYSERDVVRLICGPSKWAVRRWHAEFLETGEIHGTRVRVSKFTDEEKRTAVDLYLRNGKNASAVVKTLGYPSRTLLTQWIDELAPGKRKKTKPHAQANRMKLENKIDAIACCYDPKGNKVKEGARQIGIDPVTFYNWRNKILGEKAQAIVDDIINEDIPVEADRLKEEVAALEAQVRRLKMEAALWQGAVELIKKDQGVSLAGLTGKEKASLIDALHDEYGIEELLAALNMPKSSYYYQRQAMRRDDKYASLRTRIIEIFNGSNKTFGSLRIWGRLRSGDEDHDPVIVSEKVVRRIMAEENLVVIFNKKKRRYSSYAGETTKAPDNLVKRNFHADKPNELWLTDITEFSLPFGKVYLSPILDCFDGKIVAWTCSQHPTGDLAADMLENALATLEPGKVVTCHSDRGLHYRTHAWIDLCDEYGVVRSMSKKGCSPDNSAMEGFFGRLKNEMFYYRNWKDVDYDTFVAMLNEYIIYYNTKRIKKSLGWMSPVEYRQSLGLAA